MQSCFLSIIVAILSTDGDRLVPQPNSSLAAQKKCGDCCVVRDIALSTCDSGETKIENILAAHEATWSQLQTVSMLVNHSVDREGSGEFATYGWDHWKRRGTKEYFKRVSKSHEGHQEQSTNPFYALSLDFESRQLRCLNVPDPTKLRDIRPDRHYGISAYRAPFDRYLLLSPIYSYFLLRFQMNALDDFRTLRELRDECIRFDILESREIEGKSCIHIHCVHPGVRGKDAGIEMDIFLDPQAGNLARKFIVHHHVPESDKPDAPLVASDYVVDIRTITDYGNGVFIPTVSECYLNDSAGRKSRVHRFEVSEINLHEPIPQASVLIVFPEHTLVNVFAEPQTPYSKGQDTNVELMGSNGEALQTFHPNTDEFATFIHNYRAKQGSLKKASPDPIINPLQPPSKGSRSRAQIWLVVGILIASGCIASFWILGRRMRRSPA